MDQCAAGFVSNVAIVGEGGRGRNADDAWSSAQHLRHVFRLANPSLTFLARCSAGYAGREVLESILRDGVFNSAPMAKVQGKSRGKRQARIEKAEEEGARWRNLRRFFVS